MCLCVCPCGGRVGEVDLSLVPRLIVGAQYVVADSLSHRQQVLSLEWILAQGFMVELVAQWPASVVLFATALNYRLPSVFLSHLCPLAAGTDTFLRDWDGVRAYAFPPFALICRVLCMLTSSAGTFLTLVAPFWPKCEWFLCSGVCRWLLRFPFPHVETSSDSPTSIVCTSTSTC